MWGLGGVRADVCGVERDSRKDETVVFIFIFATAGLLIWAAVKPWVGKWVDVSFLGGMSGLGSSADGLAFQSARERRSYIPVSSRADS